MDELDAALPSAPTSVPSVVPVPEAGDAEVTVPDGVPADRPWRIESDRMAAWALDRLARVEQEMSRLQAAAEEEKGRIESWLEAQLRPLDRDSAWFRERLTEYHRRRNVDPFLDTLTEKDDLEDAWKRRMKAKSHPLPNGTVKAKLKPGRWEVTDEEALVGALGDGSEAVQVKRTVLKSKLAEVVVRHPDGEHAVAGDGEVLPGVAWKRPELGLDVTPTGEERPAWLAPMPDEAPDD